MTRPLLLPGLALASAALALGSGGLAAPADAAPPRGERRAAKGQAVTYRVGTGERRIRAVAAPRDDRRRAGAAAASGRTRSEDAARPRKVFGADDRFPIDDVTAYPWSAVCKVFAEFPDGSSVEGSAILVDGRFALTAGHVVHDATSGGFADRVVVVPGYEFGDEPFGAFEADEITSFSGWTEDRDYDWDFALLALDGSPGDDTGWLGLSAYGDAELRDLVVNTAGYPSDLDDGMWAASGDVEDVLAGQILFRGELDAATGQSGSGVWVRRDEGRYVVGVVSTETSTANRAARVTDDVFDALVEWMDGGPPADRVAVAVTSLWVPPAEIEAPYVADVAVGLANDGTDAVTATLDLNAVDWFGRRTLLARRSVFLAAGASRTEVVRADLGSLDPGTWALEAVADAPGDDFPDDDRVFGRDFVVLAPVEAVPLGADVARRLDPGDVLRLRLDVPADLERLRLFFRGHARATARVERPDGTSFALRPGRIRAARESVPADGPWTVTLRLPLGTPRSRTLTLSTRVR